MRLWRRRGDKFYLALILINFGRGGRKRRIPITCSRKRRSVRNVDKYPGQFNKHNQEIELRRSRLIMLRVGSPFLLNIGSLRLRLEFVVARRI